MAPSYVLTLGGPPPSRPTNVVTCNCFTNQIKPNYHMTSHTQNAGKELCFWLSSKVDVDLRKIIDALQPQTAKRNTLSFCLCLSAVCLSCTHTEWLTYTVIEQQSNHHRGGGKWKLKIHQSWHLIWNMMFFETWKVYTIYLICSTNRLYRGYESVII